MHLTFSKAHIEHGRSPRASHRTFFRRQRLHAARARLGPVRSTPPSSKLIGSGDDIARCRGNPSLTSFMGKGGAPLGEDVKSIRGLRLEKLRPVARLALGVELDLT